ncbi:MAG TPA: hypothetical protein VJO72_15130 [Candidatus Dormibacteraeota bacterium]|nr:hypothetical protein [Candidatus Dormibacteraeota bacterium]
MRIAIVLYQGFDELDAIGPFEVFRHAAKMGAAIDVSLTTQPLNPPRKGMESAGPPARGRETLGNDVRR